MSENDRHKYSISYQSDGSYSIEIHLQETSEAILVPQMIQEISENLRIGRILIQIRENCTDVDGVLIFPKPSKVSDEIRLVACVAAAYPAGFPKSVISDVLNIADTSSDAYLYWETKDSSQYLSYDTETQQVHISNQGINWIFSELIRRGVFRQEEETDE
ncbi:MAG: hypothetical protein ACTSWA_05665 [Candidatus Thorarchaeota archaeon]